MPHYSKRPPPAEPLYLGTGDFEAVGYAAIPRAPRAPVFNRSMPQPQGYGFGQSRYPAHYAPVPTPPHSLSPVAMNTARSASATGPQRAQPTVVIRSRPSLKMGITILVAGTLLGGVFGVGMRARQNAAEAAFAARLQQEQPLPPPAMTPQAPAAVATNPIAGPATIPNGPAALPANAYAGVPFGSLVVSPPTQQPAGAAQAPIAAAPAPVTAAPAPAAIAPVAIAPVPVPAARPAAAPAAAAPAAPKAPQKHAAWWGKPAGGGHPSLSAKVTAPSKADKDKDDGYRIASARNDDPPPKASKASKPSKEPVAAKEEPKETKKSSSKSSSRGSDEADKVLRAAMGATENTL